MELNNEKHYQPVTGPSSFSATAKRWMALMLSTWQSTATCGCVAMQIHPFPAHHTYTHGSSAAATDWAPAQLHRGTTDSRVWWV